MNVTPSTGAGRSRLLSSAASVLGFAHLAGLTPAEGAAPRQEPTLAAHLASASGDGAAGAPDGSQPPESKKHDDRHSDGKFKPAENSGDGEGEDDEDENEDGDDTSDEKDMSSGGKKAIRCARSRERARCAAILGAPEAAKNVQLAAHLAFETTLTRSAAVAALKKGGASGAGGLAGRMAQVAAPNVQAGAERPSTPPRGAVSASWDAAMKKARR